MTGKKLRCRILKEPYAHLGAGNRGDGKPRRMMVLEIMDAEFPEPGEWDYMDDVEVSLISTANRKKSSGKRR